MRWPSEPDGSPAGGCETHRRAMKRREDEEDDARMLGFPLVQLCRYAAGRGLHGRCDIVLAGCQGGWTALMGGRRVARRGAVPAVTVTLSSDHGGGVEPAENHRSQDGVSPFHTLCRGTCTSAERERPVSRQGRGAARYQSPRRSTPFHAPHLTRIFAAGVTRPSSPLLRTGGAAAAGGPVRASSAYLAHSLLLSPLARLISATSHYPPSIHE